MATVLNAQFVKPSDVGYRGWCGRIAREKRPAWDQRRSTGEHVGALVEEVVRRWLAWQGPLQEARILRWQERTLDGRYTYRYREVDAVRPLGTDGVVLYEVKVTTPARMAAGSGLDQLAASRALLAAGHPFRTVRRRLVYVADGPVPVRGGLPNVAVSDLDTDIGVVWLTPADVERFARIVGIDLPEGWYDPHTRSKPEPDPIADEWSRFAEDGHPAGSPALPHVTALGLALRQALATTTAPAG